VFGIVAQPATDDEGTPASRDTTQRRHQARIGREIGPRHGRRALLGRRIQRLEPASGVAAGDRLRRELPGIPAARLDGRRLGVLHD
jgi:hypothetical protein